MPNNYRMKVLIALAGLVVSCAAPATQVTDMSSQSILSAVKIDRHPEPADYRGFNVYTEIPKYNPNSTDAWQVDLRSSDMTKLDLSKSEDDLLYADFDSKTQWPTPDKRPVDFDWQIILEVGKDPALGIRGLQD